MSVRAIQKKWALRAVLFPWEIGGYMALAVLIAVMGTGAAERAGSWPRGRRRRGVAGKRIRDHRRGPAGIRRGSL
jgi:hypothetical protein